MGTTARAFAQVPVWSPQKRHIPALVPSTSNFVKPLRRDDPADRIELDSETCRVGKSGFCNRYHYATARQDSAFDFVEGSGEVGFPLMQLQRYPLLRPMESLLEKLA